MAKNAIEECVNTEGQFISSYFLVPKPDGSSRLIINLKRLNKFISPSHFKMEDIRSAKNLLMKEGFMSTVDLKDAYFLIPIHNEHKKFLRFKFGNKLYQFNCLPFGLCTSLYVYTKIMKPIVNKLRSEGILFIIYIDDILIINKSYNLCKRNVEKTINLLEHLGLLVQVKNVNIWGLF